jgi:tRNA A-37 threonylcarbamoyl transferase component Bud32
MDWPTPQDYNEAMQAPWLSLNDRALKSGKPALDVLGLPRPMTGAFASVYRLDCDGRSYAVKLFLRKVLDQQQRYAELSNSINSKELLYTVGFQYQPEGVNIRGANYPILKMEWVEGENLDQFVGNHISEPRVLSILLHRFRKMINKLQTSGVAHGDLQHGNILVKESDLKLVDYDGMYVSKLKGLHSNELGHPNFQHPGRNSAHFGSYLDNFSAWVIQTSLLCLSVDPSLWDKLNGGDDCLLFRRKDFEQQQASDTFRLLESHESEQIRVNAKLLRYMLMYPPEQVPVLDENIMHVGHLPAIRPTEIVFDKPRITLEAAPPAGGNGLPDWMQAGAGPITQLTTVTRRLNVSGTWPRFDQYKQAIADPSLSLDDMELRQGKFVPETKGLGTNGFVFHLRCPNRHIAVKCFKEHVPDRQKRFETIRKYVSGEARRYFIDFQYLAEGIQVGDYWYPILKMEWMTPTLNEFIHANLRNKVRLAALSDRFHNMVRAFQILGIAHGDLEPDNIFVINNDFKLVDYDGMYLPELEGLSGIERGHPAFQHPGRKTSDYGPNLDFFSAWILDAELQYLKIDPQLWTQAEIRSQVAVAKTTRNAKDFSFLDVHPSKSVRHTGDVLRKLLDYDFDTIPSFDAQVPIYTLG